MLVPCQLSLLYMHSLERSLIPEIVAAKLSDFEPLLTRVQHTTRLHSCMCTGQASADEPLAVFEPPSIALSTNQQCLTKASSWSNTLWTPMCPDYCDHPSSQPSGVHTYRSLRAVPACQQVSEASLPQGEWHTLYAQCSRHAHSALRASPRACAAAAACTRRCCAAAALAAAAHARRQAAWRWLSRAAAHIAARRQASLPCDARHTQG